MLHVILFKVVVQRVNQTDYRRKPNMSVSICEQDSGLFQYTPALFKVKKKNNTYFPIEFLLLRKTGVLGPFQNFPKVQ